MRHHFIQLQNKCRKVPGWTWILNVLVFFWLFHPGQASWACNQCSATGPRTRKNLCTWSLILCGHHLDIPNNNFLLNLCFVSEIQWDNGTCMRGSEPWLHTLWHSGPSHLPGIGFESSTSTLHSSNCCESLPLWGLREGRGQIFVSWTANYKTWCVWQSMSAMQVSLCSRKGDTRACKKHNDRPRERPGKKEKKLCILNSEPCISILCLRFYMSLIQNI